MYRRAWDKPIRRSDRFDLNCKHGENHPHKFKDRLSTRWVMKTRMLANPPTAVKARVGALSW